MYLWQQLFMNRHSHALVCAFPLNIFLAGGMALVAYFVVERPFLMLRSRINALRRAGPLADGRVAQSIDGW
jgi:peptidoglycan/LPS O-acetylase OafA/YrhL